MPANGLNEQLNEAVREGRVYGEGGSLADYNQQDGRVPGTYNPEKSDKFSGQLLNKEVGGSNFGEVPESGGARSEKGSLGLTIGEAVETLGNLEFLDLTNLAAGDVISLDVSEEGSESREIIHLRVLEAVAPDILCPTNTAGATRIFVEEAEGSARPFFADEVVEDTTYYLAGSSFGGSFSRPSTITRGLYPEIITRDGRRFLGKVPRGFAVSRKDSAGEYQGLLPELLEREHLFEGGEHFRFFDELFKTLDAVYFAPELSASDRDVHSFLSEYWKSKIEAFGITVLYNVYGTIYDGPEDLHRDLEIADTQTGVLYRISYIGNSGTPERTYQVQEFRGVKDFAGLTPQNSAEYEVVRNYSNNRHLDNTTGIQGLDGEHPAHYYYVTLSRQGLCSGPVLPGLAVKNGLKSAVQDGKLIIYENEAPVISTPVDDSKVIEKLKSVLSVAATRMVKS